MSENENLAAITEVIRFSARDMDMFRQISGDNNPMHSDAAFAAERGFAGPVVYGGLLISKISYLLGEKLPGHGCVWKQLKVEFRSPLMVGEEAILTGTLKSYSESVQLYVIGIEIRVASRLILKGEAQALKSATTKETT
jgi:acyl dehydratase